VVTGFVIASEAIQFLLFGFLDCVASLAYVPAIHALLADFL